MPGDPFETPCSGQGGQLVPAGTLFPTVPGCVKGFHSHPPCVGRPVGHRDRAGNAIAKGMAEGRASALPGRAL